jgi:predicted transcriptional regulator of viral defense system
MKYLEFKNSFRKFPLISASHFPNVTENLQVLRNQLTQWQKKGLIIKLKKGLYILNEKDRKFNPSNIFIANALYSPSYISSEYALAYYDLIPEKVETITSCTTKKTTIFENPMGTFSYQHLKSELFFGFKRITDENEFTVFIAEPEKAVLDFIYLNLQEFKNKGEDIFDLSYRLQNLERLKKGKLQKLARLYKNRTFQGVIKNLLKFIKENE